MKIYKVIFENVQKIVNEHDPAGLVSGGAPDDEYDTEVGKIVNLLRTELDKESFASKIEKLFRDAFSNVEVNKNVYLLMSQKLLDLKKRLKW